MKKKKVRKKSAERNAMCRVCIETEEGPFSLFVTARGLYKLEFPLSSAAVGSKVPDAEAPPAFARRAAEQLRQYWKGKVMRLSGVPIDWTGYSAFQRKVLRKLMRVRPGQRMSYAELARKAGAGKAARAVGAVMRSNRLPVFIPCHRVVASDGGLGGYTPGLSWKERMLALESARSGGR